MIEFKGVKIEWLGHASFRLSSGKVVYIDPFHLQTEEKADIILITHGHYDHLSLKDIVKKQPLYLFLIEYYDSDH